MDIYGLKNFKRISNVIATIICGIIVAVLVCLTAFIGVKTYCAVSANADSVYTRIGNSNTDKKENSYYALNNINVKESEDSPILKPDVFMQDRSMRYFGNYLDGFSSEGEIYAIDECAVSADFAKEQGLKEGSKFVIHVQGTSGDYTVTVMKILPEYFGYNEVDIYKQKGAVVLGYNPEAITNSYVYEICTFSEDTKDIFYGSAEIVHKEDILRELNKNYYLAASLCAISVIVSLIILDVFWGKNEREDCSVFYAETGNRLKKLIYLTLYSLYKYLPVFTVSVVLSFISMVFGLKVWLFAIVFNVISFVCYWVLSVLINYFVTKKR